MLLEGGSAGGFIWITQEGIPVKMDMLSKSGRKKSRITMTLTNLTIGAQDPQLFELPADYSAMPSFGATARLTGAALVTCDTRLLAYAKLGHVRVVDATP